MIKFFFDDIKQKIIKLDYTWDLEGLKTAKFSNYEFLRSNEDDEVATIVYYFYSLQDVRNYFLKMRGTCTHKIYERNLEPLFVKTKAMKNMRLQNKLTRLTNPPEEINQLLSFRFL